ncbi:hypothetical protein EJ04DRAFT_305053 [Polyplosphaeria fusca]|uniref:F-box domain-containing protein n=1 Tax=Polyplosphaeria fusca TaxID=682080 RepID=A0A9P4QXD0_9PLEO|nr:hypothetical protein EJ04DRAFT_305053 [Polyplosphaeria fusca]
MEEPPKRPGLVTRFSRKLRIASNPESAKKRPQKLQKRHTESANIQQEGINELGERNYSIWSETSTLVGEARSRDHTDMLHGLAHHDSFDSLVDGTRAQLHALIDEEELDELELRRRTELNDKRKRMLRKLPNEVWDRIASFLQPSDAAHLAIASKILLEKLGTEPFQALRRPDNHQERVRFLNHLDRHLPEQLLCFPCGTYHRRLSMGEEKLKADFVNNPVYFCPKVRSSYLPRMRLAFGRELPYSFIQLATRYATKSKDHGMHPDKLARRWKDAESGWSHQSRYMIHDGRLLMRIRSHIFAPPKLTPTGERMLLYDREDYLPFFSVCAHWRDGELMRLVKCALSHVPVPQESLLHQMRESPRVRDWIIKPGLMARMCDDCRPARRCPECPTEYLLEINIAEDRHDAINRFKHVLVVTRWSDVGDGSSPTASPEYCAVNGVKADYDSFSHVGRRAVAGIFEARINGTIPGQRMISLNPKNTKFGEEGHGWY